MLVLELRGSLLEEPILVSGLEDVALADGVVMGFKGFRRVEGGCGAGWRVCWVEFRVIEIE